MLTNSIAEGHARRFEIAIKTPILQQSGEQVLITPQTKVLNLTRKYIVARGDIVLGKVYRQQRTDNAHMVLIISTTECNSTHC